MRANKEHRVLALKDFQEEDFAKILKRPSFCPKRGHEKKELEFFCKRCEVAICNSCVATIHDGHAKILLEEAANECKLRIEGFVESQKKAIQQKKNDIAKIEQNCHKIQEQVGKVKRDVQAFSDNINRGLKQTTTTTATRTSPNKRFNEQNNGCARAL